MTYSKHSLISDLDRYIAFIDLSICCISHLSQVESSAGVTSKHGTRRSRFYQIQLHILESVSIRLKKTNSRDCTFQIFLLLNEVVRVESDIIVIARKHLIVLSKFRYKKCITCMQQSAQKKFTSISQWLFMASQVRKGH